ARLAIRGPAEMDRNRGAVEGEEEPIWIAGLDGLQFADLGVLCPEGPEPLRGLILESLTGRAAATCQRRAIGIGPEVVVEIALDPATELDAVVARLRIGTLDE